MRFDAISGDYRFIVTSATGVETLANERDGGDRRDRHGANPAARHAGAMNQTALLRVTDLATSSFQQTSFVIAQATGSSPGFFAIPEGVTFTGPRMDQCARNVYSSFFVYGGTPALYDLRLRLGFTSR